MLTKQNSTLRSVLFIVSFTFVSQALGEPLPRNLKDVTNNTNIHTKKDSSSPENFAQAIKAQILKNIELLKKKKAEFFNKQNSSTQLSRKEISVITTHVSKIAEQLLDDQTKAQAELQEQNQAESLPKPDAQNSSDHYVKNMLRFHWNTTEIIEYTRKSKLAARKALLEKLINIKSTIDTQTRHIRQCISTPKTETVPVITTADHLFALAAGAAIVGEFVVTGATIATGLYVGSGNQGEKNSPILQAPANNPKISHANTTATSSANAPRTNTTTKHSSTKTVNSRAPAIHPKTKPTNAHTKTASPHIKAAAQPNTITTHSKTVSTDATNAHSDAQDARARNAYTVASSKNTDAKIVTAAGTLSASAAGLTATGPIAAVATAAVLTGYGAYRGIKARKDYNGGHIFGYHRDPNSENYHPSCLERHRARKKSKKLARETESKRLKKISIVNSDTLTNDTAPMSAPDTEILTTAPINASSEPSVSFTDDSANSTAPAENDPFKKKRTVMHHENLKTHAAYCNLGSQNSPTRISVSTITPSKRRPYRNSTVYEDDVTSKTNRPADNIDRYQNSYSYRNTELHKKSYKNSAGYKDTNYKDTGYRNGQYKEAAYKSVEYRNSQYKEKKKQKLEQRKKPRQNDINRTSNSGPGQDPDDDDQDPEDEDDYGLIDEIVDVVTDNAVDAIVDTISDRVLDWSKVIYEGNPKHNPNSKGNVSKPPYNGKANIKKSVWVKTNPNGLSQRVGIENGNVIIYKEHAPNRYHGYIETNFNSNRYKDHRKALEKAGLIHAGKKFRIRK